MPGYFTICNPQVVEAPTDCGFSISSGGVIVQGTKGDKGEKGEPGTTCCPLHGDGSPEGVEIAPEGLAYVDDLTQDIYDKVIGSDAFGWVIRVPGGGGGGNIFVVGSIAQARALPSLISNRAMYVNGDMTGGDGFSHLQYTWDQASVAPNNNGSVLQSTDLGLGRWLQN